MSVDKAMRHWKLVVLFDLILAVLVIAPIWVIVHTPDNVYDPVFAALWWWPWLGAVEIGLAIYYIICDDPVLVGLIATAPKVLVYAIIIFGWWVFVGRKLLREFEERYGKNN